MKAHRIGVIPSLALLLLAPGGAASAQGLDKIIADAKAEGQLTIIAVPHDWCGYGGIIDSFKKIYAFLEKEKVAPAGPPMTIYTSTDEKGFDFRAAVPVAATPANLPDGMAAGKSPAGKALKYVHRGSYDSLDGTYERITNQLDDKGLEAQDVFVESYLTDPRTTPDDKLVIEVYVPIK